MSKTTKEVAKKEMPISARFINEISREFLANAGNLSVKLDERKKRLAQHLFIAIDAALTVLEKKRLDKGPKSNPPIVWANVNMAKLTMDAMYRIDLGLDALIPNHISIIPYLNGRTKQYDVNLQIGYTGNDYYRRKTAVEVPIDIIYELVYESDQLIVMKKSATNNIETYEFNIPVPFDRGKVVGGFGYIIFKDQTKNKLVLVGEADFLKYKKEAKSSTFWDKWGDEMRYKSLVLRTTSKLQTDPDKVSPAYAVVEAERVIDDNTGNQSSANQLEKNVKDNANKDVIDIEPELNTEDISSNPEMSDEEKNEALQDEINDQDRVCTGDGPGF